jgi:hypothetical protein
MTLPLIDEEPFLSTSPITRLGLYEHRDLCETLTLS